ncbi:TetR/AcrR family transcriptional regulator [Ahrensia kielensis]|uniref:TetR/AcrR family transcriptional regulator n=1 Tax=Ahrensia kielensis TaxID=76980 RepID=UPI00036F60EB|nr:TetR/AcrR family transcriptional regulator [Ahrensia kielensis]
MNTHADPYIESDFTDRQGAVLEAALGLLVEGGEKAITTAGIARAANCSKESLYKWFGDRDGILAAMITYQASKVRVSARLGGPSQSAEAFRAELEVFANDLLTVLSGETSLALNRLAIGQGSREGSVLGNLLIERGRKTVRERAMVLLQSGQLAGVLRFDDRAAAFDTLYSLVVGDFHVRMLLGETVPALRDELARKEHVEQAINRFHLFYSKDHMN